MCQNTMLRYPMMVAAGVSFTCLWKCGKRAGEVICFGEVGCLIHVSIQKVFKQAQHGVQSIQV
jgi:hypothetical protein